MKSGSLRMNNEFGRRIDITKCLLTPLLQLNVKGILLVEDVLFPLNFG